MAIRLSFPPFARRSASAGFNAVEPETASHSQARPLSAEALAARLQQECAALTLLYRTPVTFGCDPMQGFWLHVAAWPLPNGMNRADCPLILLVPHDFPVAAPTACFLPEALAGESGWTLAELLPGPEDCVTQEGWQVCGLPTFRWRPEDDLERVLSTLEIILLAACRIPLTLPADTPVVS